MLNSPIVADQRAATPPPPRIPHIASQGCVQIHRPQQSTPIRISCASLLSVYKTLPRPDVFAELLFTTVGDSLSQNLWRKMHSLVYRLVKCFIFSVSFFGASFAALHS